MQPAASVTVKLYLPEINPDIVVFVADPVIAPGLMVHVPVGRPLKITLPVAVEQVGWVMVPTDGAEGEPGAALITTPADEAELHPEASVTE